ncbi:MAG: small ligand-binding sensory domain FIST [Candidatus Latescibacterota bacterium]|jgi:small ligand-binding sensory domain FIST
MIHSGAGHSNEPDGLTAARLATQGAMDQAKLTEADLVFVFVTYHHLDVAMALVDEVMEVTGTENVVGCSGMGVLTDARENDREPGVAVLVMAGDDLEVVLVHERGDDAGIGIGEQLVPYPTDDALLVLLPSLFGDPTEVMQHITDAVGDLPIVGGMASPNPWERTEVQSLQWCGEEMGEDLVVGVLLRGMNFATGVTQGCQPFGQAYTITQCDGQVIQQLAFAPAVDALKEAMDTLTTEEKAHLRRNIFIGLAMDEYALERKRGDYLIRSLLGIEERSGALGINESVSVGQTVQFNRRTPDAAHEDMVQVMKQLKQEKGRIAGACGLYFNCMGRGFGLYGQPDHDVLVMRKHLGAFPMAGFFGQAEIAPVGGRNFVHSYTGVLTLLW